MSEINSYLECIKLLYKLNIMKLGLHTTEQISRLFDNPCDKYKTIHVAGTNGKGSVCYKIYTILKMQRYKVGLYTSPHIVCLRERIIVNDEQIKEEELVKLTNKILFKCKENNLKPSFFEIVTMIAFLHFYNRRVDYAIIETGLGGREDATNIIKNPTVVVITSIGYDHMKILGNDLVSICNEKIGIFKEDTNIVIGPSVSIYKNVYKKAKELNCKIISVNPEPRGETFNEENSRIAIEALKILNITSVDMLNYLIKIKLPLRLQYMAIEQINYFKNVIYSNELKDISSLYPAAIIFDIGHNETAIDKLCRDINYFHKNKSIKICISMTKPRNINMFLPFIAHFPDTLTDIFYISSLSSRTYKLIEIIQMFNYNNINDKLKQIIFDSSKKICQWLGNYNENENLETNAEKCLRGNTSTIVKNAFIESCKTNSLLVFTGSIYFFEEILNTFHIYAGKNDAIYMNESGEIFDNYKNEQINNDIYIK